MSKDPRTRREFMTAASALAVAAWLPATKRPQQRTGGGGNGSDRLSHRPFTTFRASQADNPDYVLDAVKGAGFEYSEMIAAGAGAGETAHRPSEAIAALKQKLAARGLKTNIANFPTAPKGVLLADAIKSAHTLIDNAHALGQKYALNLGIEEEERWVDWCKVLSDAAAFGAERGVKVVVKHHHGLNNTSMDLLAWIKQVNHPNFGVFFDPGNVVYYTGKDPVKQLEIIGPHVSGVVAKDCSAPIFSSAPSAIRRSDRRWLVPAIPR